jgi:polysaccharide chain length determinant protein (PEP-CTERM system associated)
MLARTLISRPNVERLVHRPELGFDVSSSRKTDALVSNLMNQIRIKPTPEGNLYDITYRGSSPSGAQHLVEATVDLFVNSSATAKKRDSQDAGRFIEAQIETYRIKLNEAEDQLQAFRARNVGVAGVSSLEYFNRIALLSEQLDKLDADLEAAAHSRDAYRRELGMGTSSGNAPAGGGDAPFAANEFEQRLADQRKQLDELLGRYTEEHPDVIATRHVIEQLEAQARQTQLQPAGSVRRVSTSGGAGGQQLRISLAELEARVNAMQSQRARQAAQLAETRALSARLPQVEAEYAQLNRDHDALRVSYESMVTRRESAALGVKLDESSQLAEFRVVEPPRVSPAPVFPSRLHLAAIALMLSIGAGLGAAMLVDALSPTLVEAEDLRRLTGRPVLGAMTVLSTADTQLAQRRSGLTFAAAATAIFALQSLWMAWVAFKPPLN